jgi:hypothetical protein
VRHDWLSSLIFTLAISLLAGCATRPTGYSAAEVRLGTRGGLLGEPGLFHDVLYNPESIALSFPGYLIGLDKGRRAAVAGDGFKSPADAPDDQWGLLLYKRSLRSDPKLHYVSHIVRNTGKPFGEGNCVFYSVYDGWGAATASSDQEARAGSEPPRCSPGAVPAQLPHQSSSQALSLLAREVASVDPATYTQLVVVVMGWNTPQTEAVQNFNAIAAHIRAAAEKPEQFRPLFIGITWASLWSSSWLEPAVRFASYPSKAHDADEVGLGWLGAALEALAGAVPEGKPRIAIGHSFGARALSSALCGYPAMTKTSPRPSPRWDLFVGWQPAVSINRFRAGGALDGFTYVDGCPHVKTMLFTASENDHANGGGFWADMIGSGDSWVRFCKKSTGVAAPTPDGAGNKPDHGFIREVACISADRVDATSTKLDLQVGVINYLDAKNIVWFNQPNTGGGSHSDIYRDVHGRVNWSSMTQAAK